jgi:assimilatory nitrate reductase catalytic subunit
MATNPVVSLPQSDKVRRALEACPFVVVSDCSAASDTLALAHVKLPALAWGEKDGVVTNSERRISRQRALLPPPGEARADWRIIADVAAAMGHGEAFAWSSAAQVFREWARLTAYENSDRILNLSALVGLTPATYDALAPVQWPLTAEGGVKRLFVDGRFQTPDGRGRMVPTPAAGPAQAVGGAYPLALNTGRVRDHWHTLTRTGLAVELWRHTPEPYVEMHPADAAAVGARDGALVRVQTAHGEAVVLARFSDRQRPGDLFMPMHWTTAYAPSGRANPLVGGPVDPRSGQPEFKHTPARVRPYRETWRGFLLSRTITRSPTELDLVWRRIPQAACQLHEFAGRGDETERAALRRILGRTGRGEPLRYEDVGSGTLREAWLRDGRLECVLFTTERGMLPPRAWLADLFGRDELQPAERALLLIGRGLEAPVDASLVVCACRGVREAVIDAAVAAGARDLAEVGEATGAGVVCGSCRPEISRRLTGQIAVRAAA